MTPRQTAIDTLLGMVVMLLRSLATKSPDKDLRLAARDLLVEVRARHEANKTTTNDQQ